jgi:transcriptional regulator with XRE-family HTH domain
VIDIKQPDFGRRLRDLRRARGLSQRDVAAGVVNPSYISLLETGARVPTLDVVVHLARALDVPLNELLEGAEIPEPPTDNSAPDQGSSLIRDLLARSSLSFCEYDTARHRFTEAYAAAQQEGNLAAAVQYGFELQDVLRALGEYQARYDLLTEITALVDKAGLPTEILIKARTDLASSARETGRLSQALELVELAVDQLVDSDLANTVEHVRTLGVLIAIRCDCGELSGLRSTLREMLDLAERLDSPAVLGRAHWVAFMAYSMLSDQEEAAHHHVLRAHDMLATPNTSMQDWMRFCRAAAAALLRVGASAAEVDRYLGPARACVELVDTPTERSSLTMLEAQYQLRFGDPTVALELVELAGANLHGGDAAAARATAGRALARLGRTDEAIDELRSAASRYEELAAYRNAAATWREIDELRSAS